MMKKNRSELVLLMFMVFFGCDQKPAKQVITYEGPRTSESSLGPNAINSSPQGSSARQAAPSNPQPPTAKPPSSVPVKTTPSSRTGQTDMKDGGSETIWFGTVPDHLSVPWTKPQDLVLDETFPSENNRYADGNFCFANGSVQYIQVEQGTDPEALRAFLPSPEMIPVRWSVFIPTDALSKRLPVYGTPMQECLQVTMQSR